MFSGIIEQKAKILARENGKFTIENTFKEPLRVGQSIAHDGACMTLESVSEEKYTFFTMEESLKKTSFGAKKAGDMFNVERCLKMGDRIDGHFLSGHIDTTGTISLIEKKDDSSLIVGVKFDESFSKYTIEKGSIALNGVSLTIVEKHPGYFSVSLIPLTQNWTNLGELELGDAVNLEFDMLGKYILNS